MDDVARSDDSVKRRPCRRAVLKSGITLAVGLSFAQRPVLGQGDSRALRPQEGDVLVKDGDASLTPLTPVDIPASAPPTLAWAMDPLSRVVRSGSRLNIILLMRFDAQRFSPATQSVSPDGVVAYSALCPHAGCDVTDWIADRGLLSCDCHSAMFDPSDGARVVDGPSPRPLPALPLKLVDGTLAVAQPFTAAIRFEEQ